jgi:Xaa-Pro aminopeptidase
VAIAGTEHDTLTEDIDLAEHDPDPPDQVVLTAEDRPANGTLPALADPAADHEDPALTARRRDVEEKHRRVRAYLDATGQDALVLGRSDSIAWFTSGGDLSQGIGSEFGAVLLYINRTSRAVVTDNVQSARVFEEELAGLGFQLKERSWYDDPNRVIAELGHRKRVISDLDESPSPWPRPDEPLRALRFPLTPLERQRLRELGRTLTLAVEATCRNFVRGEPEAAIAGHLAHRLLREGVVPVDLRVASDDRLQRYRQPIFKSAPIHKRATVAVTGRRLGLCASLTRTVSFGPVDREFRECHGLAAMVDATCIYFSRPGETVANVFRRARRIYEKYNHPHEWTLDYIGTLISYAPREAILLPDSDLVLGTDMALCWSPSVGAARSEDTVVLDARGYEVVTDAQNWPKIEIVVKGFNMTRPGILER